MVELRPSKPVMRVRFPFPAPTPHPERGFAIHPLPNPPEAGAHPPQRLTEAVEQFLLSRRVMNCSVRTVETYQRNLGRFVDWVQVIGAPYVLSPDTLTPLIVQRYLTWSIEVGLLGDHPMRGITMQLPKTLPTVPEDERASPLDNLRAGR